nr:PREDICTED: mitogen-activated protein kinase kinase kinase 15 [Lepisosteus oculatus]
MEVTPSQQAAETGGDHPASVVVGAGAEKAEITSPSPPSKQRSLRAVYVLNDGLKAVAANSPESGALQCLQRACDAESAVLTTVTFGRLDFGETSVLDTFYDAGKVHPVAKRTTTTTTTSAA